MEKKKEVSIYKKLIHSFDNTPHGFSARKLSAFTAVMAAIYATFEFLDNTTVISALMVWLTFALLCLGIITAEQVIRFRDKLGPDEKEPQPKSTESSDESLEGGI